MKFFAHLHDSCAGHKRKIDRGWQKEYFFHHVARANGSIRMRRGLAALLIAWAFSTYHNDPARGMFPVFTVAGYATLGECLAASIEVERLTRGSLIAGLCWPEPR